MVERAEARKRAREEEVERKRAVEREAAAWRRGNEREKEAPREMGRAAPINERDPREPEKETPVAAKDEESSWRRDAPAPAPAAPEKKAEAWRPCKYPDLLSHSKQFSWLNFN